MLDYYFYRGVSALSAVILPAKNGTSDGKGVDIGILSSLNSFLQKFATQLITISTTIAVLAIVVCAIGYMISSQPQTAEKFKNWGFRIFIAMAIILSTGVIISTLTESFSGS